MFSSSRSWSGHCSFVRILLSRVYVQALRLAYLLLHFVILDFHMNFSWKIKENKVARPSAIRIALLKYQNSFSKVLNNSSKMLSVNFVNLANSICILGIDRVLIEHCSRIDRIFCFVYFAKCLQNIFLPLGPSLC